MKLQSIAKLLSNKVNHEYYVLHHLQQVYNAGIRKGQNLPPAARKTEEGKSKKNKTTLEEIIKQEIKKETTADLPSLTTYSHSLVINIAEAHANAKLQEAAEEIKARKEEHSNDMWDRGYNYAVRTFAEYLQSLRSLKSNF